MQSHTPASKTNLFFVVLASLASGGVYFSVWLFRRRLLLGYKSESIKWILLGLVFATFFGLVFITLLAMSISYYDAKFYELAANTKEELLSVYIENPRLLEAQTTLASAMVYAVNFLYTVSALLIVRLWKAKSRAGSVLVGRGLKEISGRVLVSSGLVSYLIVLVLSASPPVGLLWACFPWVLLYQRRLNKLSELGVRFESEKKAE